MSTGAFTQAVAEALRAVVRAMPELARFAHMVEVEASASIPSASVREDGHMRLNPQFFLGLDLDAQRFVIAHELLHLALRTGARTRHNDHVAMNLASDAVINDMLKFRLGTAIPAQGIEQHGARLLSAEAIALRLEKSPSEAAAPSPPEKDPLHPSGGRLGPDDVVVAPTQPPRGSVSSQRPASGPPRGGERQPRDFDLDTFEITVVAGSTTESLRRLDSLVRTFRHADYFDADLRTAAPSALLDAMDVQRCGTQTRRSWMRPSRRWPQDSPWLRAGSVREQQPLRVLLDVSTSMTGLLRAALGTILQLAERGGVDEVRLIQADRVITRDDRQRTDALRRVFVQGSGDEEVFLWKERCKNCNTHHAVVGSDAPLTDLRGVFATLSAERDAETLLVLTDGRIQLPERAPSFSTVIGVLGTAAWSPPRWAMVIPLTASR